MSNNIVYLLDRVIGSKGRKLKKPNEYMYMYSKGDWDYFKNKDTKHYETVRRL